MPIDFTQPWRPSLRLVSASSQEGDEPVMFFPDEAGDGPGYTEEEWLQAAALRRDDKPPSIIWPVWRRKGGQWHADGSPMTGVRDEPL